MTTVGSILSAALIALLGFVLQGIRSELRSGLESLHIELGGVKQDVAGVKKDLAEANKSLVRIETTLIEHGRQLERMADQGERIAALEGARTAS